MNLFIEYINELGGQWLIPTAVILFIHSIPLILGIYLLDRLLRHRIRPAFLHALWLIVLLKFFVPPIGVVPFSLAEQVATFMASDSFAEATAFTTSTSSSTPLLGDLPILSTDIRGH